jgi:GTP cyclohydrolase I
MDIRNLILSTGGSFAANDNISQYLADGDLERIQADVEAAVRQLLHALVIDTDNDHNTRETAKRVAKMYVHEVFKGRYMPRPDITDFPNAKNLDQLYTVGPITVRSACSHHLVPIVGKAWIGVIPGDRVVGLSKFNRLTEWIMARPQIQEEATMQLADEIESLIKPKALAVVVQAQHMCMTWRGVRDMGSSMTTSVMRGAFRENPAARDEFLSIIRGQGYQ